MHHREGNVLHVRNVNEALPLGLMMLKEYGVPAESRGMKTIRVPGPVMTVYERPYERVLFGEVRDANPFFHLFDALWLLSGSNRAELPAMFLPRIMDFSDDGTSFYGAYGYRLRYAFGVDQIQYACRLLKKKPDTRQVVMAIWHPRDLGAVTKDLPCNDTIALDIVDDALNITVFNRSNDAIWGAYGANAVQFSVLQEYIANMVDVNVGTYCQVSNNFHAYVDNPYWKNFVAGEYDHTHVHHPYMGATETPFRLAFGQEDGMNVFRDCVYLAHAVETHTLDNDIVFTSIFFNDVVEPALRAWFSHKSKEYDAALDHLTRVQAWDWRTVMSQWIIKRADKRAMDKAFGNPHHGHQDSEGGEL